MAGALLGLAGCHQVPHHLGSSPSRGWSQAPDGGGGGSVTPAQEADVQISMGRVAEKQGDLEQAMAAYRAALTRDGRRADAYLRLAVLHDKQGKFRESAELYRKALSLQPGDSEIFCDMGYSFYLQRRWAESEQSLRQAIAINPEHRRAHNNLALLLVRDNRPNDALAEFRKGGNEPAQAHLNLAFALTMERRWESAREQYQRALALDPASQVAKDRLAQLNALIAKIDTPPTDAPTAPRTLAVSADALSPGPGVTASHAATRTPTGPLMAARPPALRDPRLVTTMANFSPPRPYTGARVTAPTLPASNDGTREWWATIDSPTGAIPSRWPGPSTGAAVTARESQCPAPRPRISRAKDISARPLPVIKAPEPASSDGTSPKRPTIPPPRPFGKPTAGRLDTNHRAGSSQGAMRGSVPMPPSVPPSATPPVRPSEVLTDAGNSRTPPALEMPSLQSVP